MTNPTYVCIFTNSTLRFNVQKILECLGAEFCKKYDSLDISKNNEIPVSDFIKIMQEENYRLLNVSSFLSSSEYGSVRHAYHFLLNDNKNTITNV